MPLTVKLKRQGGFFGFSVDPNDEGQPVLGEPSWQWPDGVEYLLETPTMHEMRVVKAKIKCADQELTLEVEDKPGLVVPVDAPFFLSKARLARLAPRGGLAPLRGWRLEEERWISNNWVEHVCKLFDFAGDAVFHYARIAATKTYDDINKRWQFDVDGVDHTFDDEKKKVDDMFNHLKSLCADAA